MPATRLPRPEKSSALEAILLVTCLVHCSSSDPVATRQAPPGKTGGSGASAGAGGGETGGSTGTGGLTTGGLTTGTTGTGGAGGSGNAGGAGSGGGGQAGTGPPRPQDAGSDVTFVWPEGTPGKGGCKAGTYQGTFECQYINGDAGPTFPVTGPISMKLVQSQQGEFLEVREGVLDGTANLFFTFRADISGRLDCRAAKFDGKLENGTYSGFLVINGTFQGPLSSSYDRVNYEFTGGVWTLAVDTAGGGCNGTWSARYLGPSD